MKAALLFLLAVSSIPAQAKGIPELTRLLKEETSTLIREVDGAPETGTQVQGDSWYFRRMMIRVRPKASFEIPGFAKLEIIPETELIWQRELPDGWTGYKP
jgi:hypothetical protein